MKHLNLPSIICVLLFLSASIFAQTASVKAENANLRGTPGMNGKIVNILARDTSLEVIKQKGTWYLVQSTDYVGWIHVDTITLTDSRSEIQELSVLPVPDSSPTTTKTMTEPIPLTESKSEKGTVLATESRSYIRGARGGCYYLNSSGTKIYVNRSFCD
jgi:hypothetical protein